MRFTTQNIWIRDLKNSGKLGWNRSCRWVLFTTWAFGFKLHLIFYRVEFKNRFNIFWRIFMAGINAFRFFLWETHSTLSLILHFNQPRSVYFYWAKILHLLITWRAEDLASVNHVTQATVEDWVLKLGLRNYGSSRNF